MPKTFVNHAAKAHFQDPKVVQEYSWAVHRVGLWKSEEALFNRLFSPSDFILELGCGAGRIAFGLYKRGYRNIQGVDLSPQMIESSQELQDFFDSDILFEVGDATQLKALDNSFDGVIFGFNGLMQIPGRAKREAAMAEVFRILKPGGVFVFTTHDRHLPRYQDHWRAEKERWEKGEQDPALLEFGDRLYQTPNSLCYIHIPVEEEVEAVLGLIGFELLEKPLRSHLALERDEVREFSDDCRFWVVKKL